MCKSGGMGGGDGRIGHGQAEVTAPPRSAEAVPRPRGSGRLRPRHGSRRRPAPAAGPSANNLETAPFTLDNSSTPSHTRLVHSPLPSVPLSLRPYVPPSGIASPPPIVPSPNINGRSLPPVPTLRDQTLACESLNSYRRGGGTITSATCLPAKTGMGSMQGTLQALIQLLEFRNSHKAPPILPPRNIIAP